MLRIFVVYNKLRYTFDTDASEDIVSLRERVGDVCQIDTRGGKNGEQKFIVLQYQGADLQDSWKLGDIGIVAGCTLRCFLREEITPKLFVHCVYNDERVELLEEIRFDSDYVATLRCIISRRIGIPVTVYRILDPQGREMYDKNMIQSYDIAFGDTVTLETWDGWSEFLKAASIGHTSHVLNNLSQDDSIARFQTRVALFIAAHHGHMDLASAVLKMGIRSDEAVGDHPTKEWCSNAHVEALKTPVHEAAEHGQLSILRIFVYHNICCVTTKDGNGLTALNVALRKQKREVALYLLTKQWSNMQYSAVILPLTIYSQIRKWVDKAKDKVLLVHGPEKSSMRYKRTTRQPGALLGEGVHVDGITGSSMNSNPKRGTEISKAKKKRQREQREHRRLTTAMTGVTGLTGVSSPDLRLPRISGVRTPTIVEHYRERLRRKNAGEDDEDNDGDDERSEGPVRRSDRIRPRSRSFNHERTVALPQIAPKQRPRSSTQQPGGSGVRNASAAPSQSIDISAERGRMAYIRTTGTGSRRSRKPQKPQPSESVPVKAPAVKSDNADKKAESSSFDRMARVRRQRKKAAKMDSSIALPAASVSAVQRPFFYAQTDDDNIPRQTLDLYDQVNEKTTWERALEALTITSTFKEKPWLQRVRMAMVLSQNHVRRIKSLQRPKSMAGKSKSALSLGSARRVTISGEQANEYEYEVDVDEGLDPGEETLMTSAIERPRESAHAAEVS